MKFLPLLLLLLSQVAMASEMALKSVKQPLYLLEAGDGELGIRIVDVPFVSSFADPEWRFSAICTPFTPCHDRSWREARDLNLVSNFGIKVDGTYNETQDGYAVTIDCTHAKRPEDCPFTMEQVIEATKTCIEQMCPGLEEAGLKLEIEVIGLAQPTEAPAAQPGQ